MSAYLPSIAVVFIDAEGFDQPLRSETIHLYNVTDASVIGDVFTDSNGVLDEQSITATAGDVIELSNDEYPLTAQWIAGVDQDAAYSNAKNQNVRYIAGNLFTDEVDPTSIDVYFTDPNDAGKGPQYLGEAQFGQVTRFPYQTQIAKTLSVYPVAKSSDFLKTEYAFDGGGYPLDVPAPRSAFGSIFDIYADLTTGGTTASDISINPIPANTFLLDGDEVRATYRGVYAGNIGASKEIVLSIGGNSFYAPGAVTNNGGSWTIEAQMMRSSSDTLRITTVYHDPWDSTMVITEDVTGLDFTTALDLIFNATTPDQAGDLTLASAKAIFIPAAPSEVNYWRLFGGTWVLNGNPWAFNP